MTSTDPSPPMDCFDLIVDELLRAIGRRFGFMPQALLMRTYAWVCRRRVRFIALVARIRAGGATRPRGDHSTGRRTGRPIGGSDATGAAAPPAPRLPRDFGWICRFVPFAAAVYGAQLAHLLTHPEMAALIAADPRVGRLLRPLLRALGVEQVPGVLPPPRTVRPPRAHPAQATAAQPASPPPPVPSSPSPPPPSSFTWPPVFYNGLASAAFAPPPAPAPTRTS